MTIHDLKEKIKILPDDAKINEINISYDEDNKIEITIIY